ncbi:putative pectate lyase C [Colletotrichum trifolii]|uniref:Putative pectate lyase C n=1 Tax=Colletotrichum trifolii TaxID=5466 RepID=A0A4R8RQI2_COLTR|nr:putative pectate lyase C [Colletotrichum trifolii]
MKASAAFLAVAALLSQGVFGLPCQDPSTCGKKVARADEPILAFPGAEGFGRFATGGRTGKVYKVTNLNDSGEGSLRDAVSQPNRIVVFDVGGIIKINARIVVSKNIYIAGQTAPGGGITVYGNGFSLSNANDAIVRYIRIRMGKGGDSGKDAVTIASGERILVDHKNNVVYNWGGGGGYIAGDSSGPSAANIKNNYFISGPSTSVTAFTRGNANFKGYVENNFYDSNRDGVLNGAALCVSTSCYSNMAIQTTPFDYPGPAIALKPEDAVKHVIAKVGASLVRDSVDKALIAELESYGKTGKLISDEASVGGVGEIEAGTPKKDTDGDGIPDDYESANGLDPNDASDGMKIGAGGYTNLEIYVNSLVSSVY